MTHQERRERRRLIAEDARAGLTAAEINARHGVGFGTIQYACKEHGIKAGLGTIKPLRDSTYRILGALFRPDASLGSIAREFHITRQRVDQIYRAALAAGVPVPERLPNERK